MDATLQTLARFADPNAWDIVPNVPIFAVHKIFKRGPNGEKVKVEVTEDDLKKIVQMARHQEQANGVCPRMTLGHMHLPKDTPEQQQPPPVGWGRNLRVGRWGPEQKIGLLADQWFQKGKKPASGDYPYRSVEYYPDTHEITGIALLRRDPELDLGLVTYERGAPCFCYSKEGEDMAEPAEPKQDGLEPTGQPDAAAPDPEFQEHFMRCVRHSFPHLEKMHAAHMKQYESGAAPAAAAPGAPAKPAFPSATDGAMPPPVEPPIEDDEEMQHMRRNFPRQYQRVIAERNETFQLRNRDRLSQYERELRHKVTLGFPIDVERQLNYCRDDKGIAISPAQFARDLQMLCGALADRQGPADFGRGQPALYSQDLDQRPPTASPDLSPSQHDRAMQYMRDKGCDWREAEEWAKTYS